LYRGCGSSNGLGAKKFTYFVYGNKARNIVENAYIKKPFVNKVHMFKLTNRKVKLVDMSDYNTVEEIHNNAPPRVKRAMQTAFQLKNGYVMRRSVPDGDDTIVDYLCKHKNGYDGYMTPKMRTNNSNNTYNNYNNFNNNNNNSKFHQEIVLCNARNKVMKPEKLNMGTCLKAGSTGHRRLIRAIKVHQIPLN